jgi:hypothetical protein
MKKQFNNFNLILVRSLEEVISDVLGTRGLSSFFS